MKIDVDLIKLEIRAWLKSKDVPNTHFDTTSYIMNNLGILYSHLLSKGLVPEDRACENAFFDMAEIKYWESL